jgi:ribonucleotide monophosphatase NagD (HAD superfamily)
VAPEETAVVGDRLYTDIRMARAAGVVAVLALTGETKRAQLESCPESDRPDIVIENLEQLGRLLSVGGA